MDKKYVNSIVHLFNTISSIVLNFYVELIKLPSDVLLGTLLPQFAKT